MKLNIDTIIIGSGYSGLIAHQKLPKDSIIVDQGPNQQFANSDYIVVCKQRLPFATEPVNVITHKISSGAAPFPSEFSQKVYGKDLQVSTFFDVTKAQESFAISNEFLTDQARIYGNIAITHIDYKKHVAYGDVLHLGKNVEVYYRQLISTMPVHRFVKAVQIDILHDYGIFISYFPIGIKQARAAEVHPDMLIEYYSDKNIPFYRKQYYNRSIYYEFCLNKQYNIKFDNIIVPGKFHRQEMEDFYLFFKTHGIYFAGRFATWDPDFLLDDIWVKAERPSSQILHEAFK